jgi:two-component system, LytTR family, response regulator
VALARSSLSRVMSELRLLIVDDERPAREKVSRLVRADSRYVLVGEAKNGVEALELIEKVAPHVVVLDITMPMVGGFEVLRAVGEARDFDVIFSTASDAHAIRAFEENAADYLVKPYDSVRLQRALDRVFQRRVAGTSLTNLTKLVEASTRQAPSRLVLHTEQGWVAVSVKDISRVSAADKYVSVTVNDSTLTVRSSMRAIQARLDPRLFVRVHRSELVHLDAVASFESFGHGDGLLTLKDGQSVVLSRTFRRHFVESYGKPGR